MLDVILFDDVKFKGYPQEPQLQWAPKSQHAYNANYRIKNQNRPCILQKIIMKDKNTTVLSEKNLACTLGYALCRIDCQESLLSLHSIITLNLKN